MATKQNRKPSGTSDGGQFATTQKPEPEAAFLSIDAQPPIQIMGPGSATDEEWESIVADSRDELKRMVARRFRGHALMPPQAELAEIPRLYGTENQPTSEKIAHAHYFVGGCDWYVTEIDPKTGEAFGVADLGYGPELGYMSIREMETILADGRHPVERDLHWEKAPLGEIPKLAGWSMLGD